MAVRALAGARARPQRQAAGVPPAVLALSLVAPALDLLAMVQPALAWPAVALLASGAGFVALLLTWLRFPRASWLFAAALASDASLVMRIVGGEVAPLLSLLAVVALGVGGAFASAEISLEAA